MRAPGAEPIDPARHRFTMEVTAYPAGKGFHFMSRLLHQKEVGFFTFYQRYDVVDLSPRTTQQVPTDDFQLDLILTRTRSLSFTIT